MTNLEIAQKARLKPIEEVAESSGLAKNDYEPLGRYKAKLTFEGMEKLSKPGKKGKLVLVTAITPTPAGEGKTTTCIGLAQALNTGDTTAIPAIREPATAPLFGQKGGGCGGGYSQVLPMEDINLSFTGDIPAVASAHNLLAAMADAHIQHGNELGFDVRNMNWPRTVTMNDRALRKVVVGLGGKSHGYPRETEFVVTPASEVMAILSLSRSIKELKERLGRIIVGMTRDNNPITAKDLKTNGAMTAILRDALRPNIAQTYEGGAAFVHGGPFGNIAHGCSSVVATECGMTMSDFLVTEAGFAADLGAEKFMNIKCRVLEHGPDVIVLVATIRALQHHGDEQSQRGIEKGFANLLRHVNHLKHYGVPIIVTLNLFPDDSKEELETFLSLCKQHSLIGVVADPWNKGGDGCMELADAVKKASLANSNFQYLYDLKDTCEKKLDKIIKLAYGGERCELSTSAKRHFEWAKEHGMCEIPICVAKTQYSFTDDSKLKNAPSDFTLHVNEIRLSAGAGFLVAQAGDILLMPGLGRIPNAHKIDVDDRGNIVGLF